MIIEFVAGWIGGMIGLACAYPFDTIKVVQQNYGQSIGSVIKDIYKKNGIRGFYSGILAPMTVIGPANSVFFGVYGNTMHFLEPENVRKKKNSYKVFAAGCFSGLIQVFLTCPAELVKIKQQANQKKQISRTTLQTLRVIYKRNGIRGLYKGMLITFIRDVPTSGIYTLTYETLRFTTFENWDMPTRLKDLFAGGFAGIVSTNSVLPIDVIKTKIQADNIQNPYYHGIVDSVQKVYREEKLSSFFRGFNMTFIRVFSMHAIVFMVYDIIV